MFENPNYPKGDWRRYSTMQADHDQRLEQKKLDVIRGQEIVARAEAQAAVQQHQEEAWAAAGQARREAEMKAQLRPYYTGTQEMFERNWTAIRAHFFK